MWLFIYLFIFLKRAHFDFFFPPKKYNFVIIVKKLVGKTSLQILKIAM